MFTPALATNVVLLAIVLVKVVQVSEDFELDLARPLVSEFLALLLANITLIMFLSEMPIQGIIVVKVFVVAVMTGRMLLSLVLADLIAPVQLLLEEEDGLVFET